LSNGPWFNLHCWFDNSSFLISTQKKFNHYSKNNCLLTNKISIATRFKVTKWHNFQLPLIIFWVARHNFDLGWPRLTLF
jgi:hypothetical protein